MAQTKKRKRVTKKLKKLKKQTTIFAVLLIIETIALIGVGYAWLTLALNGTKGNNVKAGTFDLQLNDENSDGINLVGTIPMLDEVGMSKTPYRFTLTNTGTVDSGYTIYLDDVPLDDGEQKIPDNLIKFNLTKDNTSLKTSLLSTIGTNPNRVLDTGFITKGTTVSFDLRLWLDENFTTIDMGKVFKGKIRVVVGQVQPLEYVTDGLVLYYDAINRGTNQNTWLDLSGHGNDGTLVSFDQDSTSGWTETSLKFDGKDDVINLNAIDLDTYTVEFVVKSTKNNYNGLLMDASNSSNALAIGYHVNNALFYFNANQNNGLVQSSTATLNTIRMFTFEKESSTSSNFYANGVSITHTQGVDHKFPSNNLVIGNSLWGYLEGELYAVRIYDRSLSQDEVQQNLLADQSKYAF